MTLNQQRGLYFPLWQKVAAAHQWRMQKSRLLSARLPAHGPSEAARLYNAVWDAAETLAARHARAVTADDLRHACHVVALGKDCSSAELTNKQLDRVIALFRVLVEPTSIAAQMQWADPEIADRKRLEHAIEHAAPFAYIDKICRDKFGPIYTSPYWEDLPIAALKQLALTLRNRANAARQPIRKPEPALAGPIDISHNQPF